MQELDLLVQSRRGWLAMAAGAFASWVPLYGFADKDFWNTKDPAEWNSDEIKRLVTRSPWAKQVAAEKVTKKSQSSSPMIVAPPVTTSKKGSTTSPKPPRQSSGATTTWFHGTVAWESAAPLRAIDKSPLPPDFAGMYVLSISGVPLTQTRSVDRVRQVTTLRMKGHEKDKKLPYNRIYRLIGAQLRQ